MLADNTERAQTLSLENRKIALKTYRQIMWIVNRNTFNLFLICCSLTVCLICGARCLFPADGFGCLSIEAGADFLLDSTIGSLSLEVNLII